MSIELCQKDLPNFPDEIIRDWLATYIETEGWPPCEDHNVVPENRWAYLLGKRPVRYWQSIIWEKKELQTSELKFTPESESTLAHLIEAYVYGKENIYSIELGENGFRRYSSLLMFVAKNTGLPVPPVMISHEGLLEVVDGNHRITACLAWLGMQNKPGISEKLGYTPRPFDGKFIAWVGKHKRA